jgi:ParB family chromosome partitioning protein
MRGNRVLGRGLSALIQGADEGVRLGDREARLIPLASITANPLQPRKSFEESGLNELADSIRQVGVLQPILVRLVALDEEGLPALQAAAGSDPAFMDRRTDAPDDLDDPESTGGAQSSHAEPEYRLVAGERRVRAARLAGLREVPAIICTYAETEALRVALLENIQREDLDPLEEATAYRELLEAYGATQEELAEMLGKRRSSVANALRLLALEEEIQEMVRLRELTRGHAKALLGLDDPLARLRLARLCRSRGLSVRECERRAQAATRERRRGPGKGRMAGETCEIRALRERAEGVIGAPVRIERNAQTGRGALTIRFYSDQELERLLELLGVDPNLG